MTDAPLQTVSSVLARFDTDFVAFSSAFHNGDYVLWLGSGISRERVPNLRLLLERVIELLRVNIDANDDACVYRRALGEVLNLAGVTEEERKTVDLTIGVATWPLRDRILNVLITQYSKVLDVTVGDDNPEDYLVWSGLDVPNTYGDPALEPDVEHYAIAVLMREGLVSSAVTANWDGLLEKALGNLTPAFSELIQVVVTPEDFREINQRIAIVKFHGCAVRARDNEEVYRPLLIARQSQIAGWTAKRQNETMRKHLENLYTDRPTLMIGLSAQDANLQTVFANAFEALGRDWPENTPTVVLSEEQLQEYHRTLLRLTYGPNYHGNATAISKSALLGSYGKPTLLALVIATLAEKFGLLLGRALGSSWHEDDVQRLQRDLVGLRNEVAKYADVDRRSFLENLIDLMDLAMTVFRYGSPPTGPRRYSPLSDRPISHAIHSPDFPSEAFGRLGVALSLVSRGQLARHWSIVPGDRSAPEGGVLRLVTGERDVRVFFVKDSAARTALELDGGVNNSDADVFLVVANEEPPVLTRSSRPRFGRTGKVTAGHFSVARSTAATDSADDLYEAFKLAGGF